MSDDFTPTDEQAEAVHLASTGYDLAIHALAGAGKTSTLKLIGEARPDVKGDYLAFNRAIADEAAGKMPHNIRTKTIHQHAYNGHGVQYRDRMNAQQRMRYRDLATKFGIDPIVVPDYEGKPTKFSAAAVAACASRAVDQFCTTAHRGPGQSHVPFQAKLDRRGEFDNNNLFSEQVAPYVRKMWDDLWMRDGGIMFYTPTHFLKQWQLGGPTIHNDVILYDEAQDANAVMLAVIDEQEHAQKIFVGDPNQQIYSWMGAVNAMDKLDGETCFLTQSFRFGPNIAEAANEILDMLGSPTRVVGSAQHPGIIGAADKPDAVLCRTNAGAVGEALGYLEQGLKVALVGGVDQIIAFAKAARSLMDDGWTSHADLAVFDSWHEVIEFCNDNTTSSEHLDVLVSLIERFGTLELIARLNACTKDETRADIVVSTAHKSKGREWPTVMLSDDFPDLSTTANVDPEELRLIYVALTRAQQQLDNTWVGHWLYDTHEGDE